MIIQYINGTVISCNYTVKFMKKNRTVGHFRLERENVGDRAMGWEGKEGKEQGVARREGGIQQDF